MKYPVTRKDTIIDNYFGIQVQDPYRWLEDDKSAETAEWVEAQNAVTQDFLNHIPFRSAIQERLKKLMDYEKFSQPFKRGVYTYFYKNSGLQNQSVLYRQLEDGTPEVFLDPNTFSESGTSALAGISFSKDGSMLAYQVSEGGADWTDIYVLDAATKQLVAETITNVKFSGVAWKGNTGFYYSTYTQPKEGSQLSGITDQHCLYYHTLGTGQSEDQLVFGGAAQPRRYVGAELTEDERFLVITAANSTSGNELYIKDFNDGGDAGLQCLVDNFEQNHDVLCNVDATLYIYTNLAAPNGRIVTAHVAAAKPESWKDLIPETENVLSPSTGGGKIFANYIKDAVSMVKQYAISGALEQTIDLPGLGTATGFSGKIDQQELYYTFTSYIYPPTIFKYTIANGSSEIYKTSGVQFDPSLYTSTQVFYNSKDGTRVPMIITHQKGLVQNGQNPTVLYGYGGFNVSLTPGFSTAVVALIEQGGVYAVANLRGGGEYGEAWHVAGTQMQKQNVFDDFIAAAEFLITEKYTSSRYLAAMGGSNGGLLVAATLIQRPDLFKVGFPAVGVLDMLRYHKFTAGAGWSFDYGTSEDSKEMFEYLLAYSPVQAIKAAARYPAMLITTADHDDRVVPAHSFKFAATIQEKQGGEAPVLIRIETNAGHGSGKPTDKVIAEIADKWAFLLNQMGLAYNS
ncbi:prolyl oligopeptidase family serine peptidase [Pedobacter duraquae]|uniref:prolyl oligopeptidase n=1 Tax=Pedobacter duraquae TaxID=425511 RepID=A0A4R6IPW3_9SPHI|nr:prolyl oligopeptidase family serine peptidase [Pedobacter duraquae]TDO23995.1 prolyl oligopeptidase [Pedobacter duraquae]